MSADGPRLEPTVPGELAGYPDDIDDSRRAERRVVWKELVSLAVVVAVVVVRQLWLV